jgi:hypothetical protein
LAQRVDALCMPPCTCDEAPNPTVRVSRIRSYDDPRSPNGTTFHLNWPICERKLVFYLVEIPQVSVTNCACMAPARSSTEA